MRFKVLTFNIHKGFSFRSSSFTLHLIKQQLRDTQADFLFLQEVLGEHAQFSRQVDAWPTESQFEFLADEVWPHFAYGKNAVYPAGHHGNALLSRFPIKFYENIDLSLHRFERRGLLHAQVEFPDSGQSLDLFNTHLNLLHRHREQQIERIFKEVSARVPSSAPLILAGDFNDWTKKASKVLAAQENLKEAHQVLHGSYARSFPSFFPLLKLDRIYFRKLKLHSIERLHGKAWRALSDHLALLGEFELPSS